jgi:hypothetical protein
MRIANSRLRCRAASLKAPNRPRTLSASLATAPRRREP